MSPKIFRTARAGAATIALLAASGPAIAQDSQPNILLIVADDLGYSDLGAFGGEIATPNLDALAASGQMLTNFYVNASCSPTRSMLLGGVDNTSAGVGIMAESDPSNANIPREYGGYLGLQVAALPEVLQDEGYRTIMAGKWHQGSTRGYWPVDRGFDHSFALLQAFACTHFKPTAEQTQSCANTDWVEDGAMVPFDQLPDNFYTSDYFADYLIDTIGPSSDEPFFAYLAFDAPHFPLQVPQEEIDAYRGRYDQGYEAVMASRLARQQELGISQVYSREQPSFEANITPWNALSADDKAYQARVMEVYAGMVTRMDSNIGRVIDHLRQTGELANTLIIFMSDNGPEGGSVPGQNSGTSLQGVGGPNSNVSYGPAWAQVGATPERWYKFTGFDGGTHSPVIINYPALIAPGKTAALADAKDIFPTILEVTGSKAPGSSFRGRDVLPLEGASLLPVLEGKAEQAHPDDYVFALQMGAEYGTLQYGSWRLAFSTRVPDASAAWYLSNKATPEGQWAPNLAASEPEMFELMLGLWTDYAQAHNIPVDPESRLPVLPAGLPRGPGGGFPGGPPPGGGFPGGPPGGPPPGGLPPGAPPPGGPPA